MTGWWGTRPRWGGLVVVTHAAKTTTQLGTRGDTRPTTGPSSSRAAQTKGHAPHRLDSERVTPITEEDTVAPLDRTSATLSLVVEDAIADYEANASELDDVLRRIAAAHARDTLRRQREIRRLTEQRNRWRQMADQARHARALLPAGALS